MLRNRRLNRLYGLIAVGIIIATATLAVNTVEIVSDIQTIRILPDNFNPYQRLYDEMLSPTVRIESASGIGSGVVIHRRGAEKSIYILSAAHVVGTQSVVTVTIYTPLTPLVRGDFTASVVITDTSKDLALLKLNLSNPHNPRLYTAKLAPRDYTYYLFTPVYAIGCSLGLDPRPSSGIISAITLSGLCVSAVEVTSPILPGNSGGPVYDANTHKVIGIAVWVHTYRGQLITTMAGIVPITEIYKFLDEFYRKDAENAKTGCNSSLNNLCASAVNLYQFIRYGEVSSGLCTSEEVIPADRTMSVASASISEQGRSGCLSGCNSLRSNSQLRKGGEQSCQHYLR